MLLSAQPDQPNVTANTGGGALVEGDVQSSRDFVGRDKVKFVDDSVDVVVHNHPQDSSAKFMVLALVSVVAIVVILLGFLYARPTPTPGTTPPSPPSPPVAATATVGNKAALQGITFQYTDAPTNHGWKLTESPAISHSHPLDGHFGQVLAITATTKYALSYAVKPATRSATQVEAIVKLEKDALFYVETELQSQQGTATKKMWFKFKEGAPAMKPVASKTDEWQIVMEVERLEGGWQKFQIDLVAIIDKTVGQQGWRLGQLKGFRVRGNLTLAVINVYP